MFKPIQGKMDFNDFFRHLFPTEKKNNFVNNPLKASISIILFGCSWLLISYGVFDIIVKINKEINFLFTINELAFILTTGFFIFYFSSLSKKKAESQIDSLKNQINHYKANSYELCERNTEIIGDQLLMTTLLDSIPDLIFFKDSTFKYVYLNKAFEQFVGLNPDQIIGKTDYDIFDQDSANLFRSVDLETIKQNSAYKNEECVSLPIGRTIHHETIKIPYYGPDKQFSGIIGISRDVSERKARDEEIKFLNYHDSLTKLYNRHFFEEELSLHDHQRQLPISIIFADIDGLKNINEEFGHEIGDMLLVETSRLLKANCRQSDIVVRIGGDEFCILLPKASIEIAKKICDRVQDGCDEIEIVTEKSKIRLSISTGYAVKTNESENINDIISSAEDFMMKRKLLKRNSIRSDLLSSIKATMVEKSHETAEHAERLVRYSKLIGELAGLTDKQLFDLELTAALHDIGKMSIDHRILAKKGKLTENEWAEIKKHPETGYRIALSTAELMPIAEYILAHHERWDGCGYPLGLQGEEIPIISRIVSIADAFDAMTENRSYRTAMSHREALEEIERNSGAQFDPLLSRIFVDNINNHLSN